MKYLSLLLCCLLLAGCAGGSPTPAATATQPTEALTLYVPNEQADGFVKTTVSVQAITKENVVEQLIASGVLADGTTVNTLEIDSSSGIRQIKADFSAPFHQTLQAMGTSGEYVIIGSVVNTFLAAFDADEMLITVDGAVLETGHSVYDQPLTFYPENP